MKKWENNLTVKALVDIPSIVSLCKLQGVVIDKTTKMQLISYILNAIGPYYGYKVIEDMMKNGLNNWDGEDFEVEKILNHVIEKGEDFFLIKWNGWSSDYNSWVTKDNLSNCNELLESFENSKTESEDIVVRTSQDVRQAKLETLLNYLKERYHDNLLDDILIVVKESKMLMKLLRNRRDKIPANHKFSKFSKLYKVHRAELCKSFTSWEKTMNSDPKFAPIRVENKVDMEGLPNDFVYISSRFYSGNIKIDDKPGAGCQCTDGNCLGYKRNCCGPKDGYEFAYTKFKRLRIDTGEAIYECNKNCSCDESCRNRVVQLGRKVPLCLFRTHNGRGWGVKSVRVIKKGTFVEEYIGEVITSDEAERRGQTYDIEGLTYLFDLDFHERDCAFTIDAKTYGNISHFVNHSCDPNLGVFNVWIDNHDERLPRIALFAIREIKQNEELTFDYKMNINDAATTCSATNEVADTIIEDKNKDAELENSTSLHAPIIPDYWSQTPSESSKSLVASKDDSFEFQSGVDKIQKDLRIVLSKELPHPMNLIMDFPLSNTPSISMSELSLSENPFKSESLDQDHKQEVMRLRPRKRSTGKADLKTKSWVSSGRMFVHSGCHGSYLKFGEKVPLLKRMRIPCNCGATTCKKWLC